MINYIAIPISVSAHPLNLCLWKFLLTSNADLVCLVGLGWLSQYSKEFVSHIPQMYSGYHSTAEYHTRFVKVKNENIYL